MGFAIAKKFAAEKFDVQLAARRTEILAPQKSDIEIAKRMLNVQKDVPAEQIFDFRFTREVYKELRELGWERALRTTGK